MLTITKSSQFTQNTVLIEGVCLSTDTKPTTGIANGSTIIEINTGKTYMFDEEGSEWDEIGSSGGGGGGGGGSDFSTATVTLFMANYEDGRIGAFIESPNIDEYDTLKTIIDTETETVTATAVLYKGVGMFTTGFGTSVQSVSGDAVNEGYGVVSITGDCTINYHGEFAD